MRRVQLEQGAEAVQAQRGVLLAAAEGLRGAAAAGEAALGPLQADLAQLSEEVSEGGRGFSEERPTLCRQALMPARPGRSLNAGQAMPTLDANDALSPAAPVCCTLQGAADKERVLGLLRTLAPLYNRLYDAAKGAMLPLPAEALASIQREAAAPWQYNALAAVGAADWGAFKDEGEGEGGQEGAGREAGDWGRGGL